MDQIHPQLDEAVKRLDAAKETYGRAVVALDRQYLKPLIAAGDPKAIAAITKLRSTYADVADAVADVSGKAVGYAQPAAPTPRKAKTAKKR